MMKSGEPSLVEAIIFPEAPYNLLLAYGGAELMA
jgi:hypothetical protein